jgi:sarcosine oxidase subunit beta
LNRRELVFDIRVFELKLMVLIIGGGIVGLTTAYNIALQSDCKITIIEQGYVGSGASTRNAGHFRVHFWAPENIRFAVESSKRLMQFTSKNGLDPEIHYGGYLWLLFAEEQVKAYNESNNESWTKMGVPGKFLQPKEVSEEYPYLNVEGVIAGFQGPQNGKLNPNIITLGYYKKCKEMGVKFLTYTKAEKLVLENGKVTGVQTNRGFIEAKKVLVAAGAWSGELLKTANIDLPLEPERKEIGVTEPIKYFLDPFVISMKNNAYVGQMLRGEVIGSIEYPIVKGLVPLTNTLDWYHAYAKAVSEMIPLTKHLMFLRSWAGYYAITPDHSHILGREPAWPENLHVATGFSGHGLMMAPLTGELMAKNILNDEVDELMKPFLPTRFKEGTLLHETMKIG